MQGQIYSPVKNHPQPPMTKVPSLPLTQIQRPIPQYPSQRSAQQQSLHKTPPQLPQKHEPYSTQSLYKNYPFEGITKTPSNTAVQIGHNTQPKDHTIQHHQQALPQPPLPQQAKATLLQRFQENLTINNPEKIAEMALMKECDIEKFAQDNLNLHSKGIFRKKVCKKNYAWHGR